MNLIHDLSTKARDKATYTAWRMHQRFRGKRFVHVLHIGKTGGSALKQALQPHRVNEKYALVLHHHNVRLSDVPNGERVVFFLRDPVARFVSAFNFRLRQGQPGHFSPWEEEEARVFRYFRTPNQLATALYANAVSERRRAAHAMKVIGHLRRPQSDWIGNTSDLMARQDDLFFIGFQETLAADFDRLGKKLGLPPSVALPSDPIRANRAPSTDDSFLDDTAVHNLGRWYAQDYKLIAVCRKLVVLINGQEVGPLRPTHDPIALAPNNPRETQR